MQKKAVIIISGGMDSSLCGYIAKNSGYELIALHFSYGQLTEKRELKSFRDITKSLDVLKTFELDISFIKKIGGSALTDKDLDVPITGIEQGVPITYVPYRNGIFLSIATAVAEQENAEAIYIGVVEEDSSGYPDCREDFISTIQNAINLGTKDETKIKIMRPLVGLKKSEIVKKALELKVPLELTWSCYQNSDKACGVCDSCRLRLNGFKKMNKIDNIDYINKG